MNRLESFFLCLLIILGIGSLYGVELDGVILGGEYDTEYLFQDGAFKVYLKVESPYIFVGIEAQTTGWVGIGFDPVSVMDQADMVIAWIDSGGKVHALDCFSTGLFGPHPPDTDLGGTNDLRAFGGKEERGKTVVEFQKPLKTSDSFDKPIDPTKLLKIIWAYGETDGFDDIHIAAGSAEIDLQTGKAIQRQAGRFLFLHILFMSSSVILMASGVGIARFLRKRKWWLKVHRRLGILSAICTGMGLGFIVLFVERTGGRHLAVPHAWVGLVAVMGAFLVPLLGQAFLKLKWKKQELRFFHRWGGRVTVSLMGIAALMGLRILGIL
ncbi:MAG: cytochrome and DOMON domain-containing protein [Spirochaetes bacterium]|nr:cytochrome and DOMON domain-containing protein [Spirochaetota bacterium]